MQVQRLTLENKFMLGAGVGFLIAVTFSVAGTLLRAPAALSSFWWVSVYQALSLVSLPVIISLGFYYAKKWNRAYPFKLVIIPNLIFILLFVMTPASDFTLAAITLVQLLFLFPRVRKTPILRLWAYVYWTFLYLVSLLLLTLSVQVLTGMV